MIQFASDDGFRRITLWKDEVPFKYDSIKKIETVLEAGNNTWSEGTICIEAKLNPRHASNYAMLCVKYTYLPSKTAQIIINYGNNCIGSIETHLFNKKAVVVLDEYFARAVSDIFQECFSDTIPCGVVEVLGGGYDEIGSSYESFKSLLQIVVSIFSNYDKFDDDSLGKELLGKMLSVG